MKSKILISALLITVIAIFTSCEKDETASASSINLINGDEVLLVPSTATLSDEKSVVQSEDPEVVEAEEFAKLLAASINGKDVRKFLKDEANKKFDGDFDILVSKVIDTKIGGVSFKDKVAKSSSHGVSKGNEIFNNAIKNPKLNISVPVLVENWNDTKQQLLVGIAVGTIEGETEHIKAFDSKGRIYLIDANVEPDVPVIMVSNNERLDSNGIAIEKSSRVSGCTEKITYVKCPNLIKIESWFHGAPELRFDCVVYLNSSNTASQAAKKFIYPSSRDQASEGFFISQPLFSWYFDDSHGPNYYIQCSEIDDSGVSYKITVGVTGGKKDVITGSADFELTYKEGDDLCAGQLINYKDSSPTVISDATIFFKVYSISN